MRRTKILATLGPASESRDVLKKMIEAGVNTVRCNFSHGTPEDHKKRVNLIRSIAKEIGVYVGILGDLQGPKIRVAKFKEDSVILTKGDRFILDADLDKNAGTKTEVGIDYKGLPKDVVKDDILLLDDGKIVLVVDSIDNNKVITTVSIGGKLSNNKGINKKGGGLTAPALTEKDKKDIKTAAEIEIDYLAVSFPRDGADLEYARELLQKEGWSAGIVAKIERVEAVDNIDDIIRASDAIMVARGDLAVEVGDENVPAIQKMIIAHTRKQNKVVITATQMMESMISNSAPTRAEASDVANAVLDGTDAVMLSAESAAGEYPVETVEAMSKICIAAENNKWTTIASNGKLLDNYSNMDEAIAYTAVILANHVDAKALISLTESGRTALWMSRINSSLPIYGLSRNKITLGLMTLYRGVIPMEFDSTKMTKSLVNKEALSVIEKVYKINENDNFILTSGDHMGTHGGTNKIKIIQSANVI